jgi:hypothetical protein
MPVPQDYKPSDTRPESKYLRAEDYPLDTKWRLVIEDVNLETMPARDGKPPRKRLVVAFEGRDKSLALNATNLSFIEARLGQNPNNWTGATVILHRTTTLYAGETVAAFRLIECKKPSAAPKAKTKPVEVEPLVDEEDLGNDQTVPF